MDEREELKQELQLELQWVKYRQKMLDIMEKKLLEMREIAEQAKHGNLTALEIESLNYRLKNLAEQVKAIDSESKRIRNATCYLVLCVEKKYFPISNDYIHIKRI